MLETIEIRTRSKTEFIDITSQIRQIVQKSGIRDGICYLFVPHTTAGLTINENADPSVQHDMLMEILLALGFCRWRNIK